MPSVSLLRCALLLAALWSAPLAAQSAAEEPAPGSRWLPYSMMEQVGAYVDTTRLVRLSASRFAAWTRSYFRTRDAAPGVWDSGTRYLVRRIEFDCDAVRSRTTRSITYNVSGGVTHDSGDRDAEPWSEPIPDSFGEFEVQMLCALRPVLPLRGTP